MCKLTESVDFEFIENERKGVIMIRKKIIVLFMILVIAFNAMCVGASAETIKDYREKNTSGGTNGYVTMRTEVYSNTTNAPTGGASVNTYGVRAFIKNNTNLTTSITLSGTMYSSTSTYPFSKNGNSNRIDYSVNSSRIFCASKTVTSSSAFGSSSYECNAGY